MIVTSLELLYSIYEAESNRKGQRMDNNQIAFIICVNDDFEYAECQYYLSKLKVPDGFSMDVITIREASSMAEGYNAGMQSSNAKYKVYMHQDTFIINENFIQDILEGFSEDDKVGLMGVVGCRMLPENAVAVSAWDTGKVYHNFGVFCGYQNEKNIEVDAVDGLMMVTQYDIPWREDLFTQWDYYDISQCYEFRRAGYKTVVPCQKDCWCYHDNKRSLISSYMKCRDIFVREYQDFFSIDIPIGIHAEECIASDQMNVEMKENVAKLIDLGKMDEVKMFLSKEESNSFSLLEDYRIIKNVLDMEQDQNSQMHFYHNTMNHSRLMEHFKALRHYLKRLEYGKTDFDLVLFRNTYSLYASMIIAKNYCDNLRIVNAWINELYGTNIDMGEYSYMEMNRRVYSISEFANNPLIFSSSLVEVNLIGKNVVDNIRNALVIVHREEGKITDSVLKENIKVVREYNTTMVRWMLGDEIYIKGRSIIVCGEKSKNYASLYHNTDIPVKWFVEGGTMLNRKYSKNIEIVVCRKEYI